MRFSSRTILVAGLWFFCLASSRGDTFTVTTASSLGPGSLYEAINQANAHPGADTIGFNIPGDGEHVIIVGDTGLPEITDPVTIDGYTQPGAKANSVTVGDNAVILIRIDGTYTGDTPHHGLIVSAGDSVIRGLALTGFPTLFNGTTGEILFAGIAITLQGQGNNSVEGNFVGISSDELPYGGDATGVEISSSNNTVGGTLPAQRNVFEQDGGAVIIDTLANGTVIEGNYLGTDPSGTVAKGNAVGVLVGGTASQIGGLTAEAANVISGNQYGIYISSSGSGNVVQGNLIGTDATGLLNLANFNVGVAIAGSNNLVGGLATGAGNKIFFNSTGVQVARLGSDCPVGNSILSNRIWANAARIDLDVSGNFEGPTRNDLGDGDTGPNGLQNFPIITATTFLPDRTTVEGGLNSTPSSTFTIQLFTQGSGTDFAFLATKTVTTDAAGLVYFSFDFEPLPSDLGVIATATDAEGNTSEFPGSFDSQLANISTRGQVGAGDEILISGFVVHRPPGGSADYTKKVLLRTLGPSLAVDGVPLAGRLENPTLELHDATGALLASNDDWRTDQEAEILATGIPPASDAEAAIVADLPDGSYTAQVRGVGGTIGLGLTEVYDIEPLDPPNLQSGHLVNISTRGLVGTGDEPLIGGLIVNGDEAERVIIRAIGPDLTAVGVPNALQDPTLELRDGSGALLASNDDWRDEQEDEIAATGLAPNDDRDSAILFSLIPGNYTAIIRGQAESTGVALAEVYDLNPGH